MMTKKVVGLLTAAIFVFAFAMSAQADWPQETNDGKYTYTTKPVGAALNPDNLFQLNACENCQKCPDRNVPCPQVQTSEGVQGAVITTVTDACPFDYDGTMFGDLSYGYATPPGENQNCRVVLNACQCPESCELDPGTQIGIQMTILTPGVYWAADPNIADTGVPTVSFQNFPLNSNYCGTDETKNFGEIRYYQAYSATEVTREDYNTKGKIVRSFGPPATPVGGCLSGNVSGAARAKVLESYMSPNGVGDYTVTADDVGRCKFWIDIPAMRLDGTAKKGDPIQVRVTLLWNRVVDSLCSECDVAIMCECIRTVGIVCPDTQAVDTEKGCIFFPYVFQGLDAGAASWQSGIAVSALNRDVLPANAYCELTVKDQEGNIATYKNTAMGNKLVWAFVLDQIIDNFTNASKLVPGAVSLEIKSNYRMDGYSFMMADMDGSYFGAGAMARGCEGCCP
jgi:hypothetical protein